MGTVTLGFLDGAGKSGDLSFTVADGFSLTGQAAGLATLGTAINAITGGAMVSLSYAEEGAVPGTFQAAPDTGSNIEQKARIIFNAGTGARTRMSVPTYNGVLDRPGTPTFDTAAAQLVAVRDALVALGATNSNGVAITTIHKAYQAHSSG